MMAGTIKLVLLLALGRGTGCRNTDGFPARTGLSLIVRFARRFEGNLAIRRGSGRESAITHQFPALESECRKTYGFLACADASLIGHLMAFLENV